MVLRRVSTAVCVASVLALVTACAGPGAGKTAYVGAELFDGTGAPITHDAVILVADGQIEAIGPPDLVEVPRGAEVYRLDGRWVVPGLIDAHTHAERWMLRVYLSYGVTTIRDVGGMQDSVVALRTDVETGAAPGPRLYISGAAIDGPPGARASVTVVRTPADARRAVGNRVLIDATQIKVYPKLDRRMLQALLDEASSLETPVTAHLGRVDAVTAAGLGVSAIEHLTGVVEATSRNARVFFSAHADYDGGWAAVARGWAGLDSASLHRTARRLLEADVTLIPTLAYHDTYAHLNDLVYREALDLSAVPESVRETWDVGRFVRRSGLRTSDFTAFIRGRSAQNRFVRLFRRDGGKIAAGGNSPNLLMAPGEALHRELEALVAAGLDTEQALLAATRDAARLLGVDSIGVLRAGAAADFVVLTADPLADIANTRQIMLVVSGGDRFAPNELRTP